MDARPELFRSKKLCLAGPPVDGLVTILGLGLTPKLGDVNGNQFGMSFQQARPLPHSFPSSPARACEGL